MQWGHRGKAPISFLVLLAVLIIFGCDTPPANTVSTPNIVSVSDFAKCLTQKGVTVYGFGTDWCTFCTEQKGMFGFAWDDLNYVECSISDDFHVQSDVCNKAGIIGYPTWVLKNGEKIEEKFSFELLSEKTGCPLPSAQIDTGTNGGGGGTANCPTALQACGNGCIPANALCCDDGIVNSYCLQPTTSCGEGTCNNCPEGQVFCGMFCKPIGEKCCIGGVCPDTKTINNPPAVDITLVSASKVICTFQRTESLWSPDRPWDGSYVCRGTVTLDFHGLTFSSAKTLKLYIEHSSNDSTGDDFDEYEAQVGTPINEVTFNYSSIGGDYFQKNKPDCPAPNLDGLRLVEKIPAVEDPFPAQNFDVTISSECQ